MRVLIVDDEGPARERLRHLLAALDTVEIVGEAEDGEHAIAKIAELRPDLVLLDIQMPGCSGIEVAASLPSPRPKIVFCTAFDQYAVDAFELSATDYLLKPVSRARLAKALSRTQTDADLDRVMQQPRMAPARFLGLRGARFIVIPQKQAVYLSSEMGLTKLYTPDQWYVMEPTLNDFEARLDSAVFFRISRAAVVNLDYVAEVESVEGGYGEALLKTGVRLEVSRRRLKLLMSKLQS